MKSYVYHSATATAHALIEHLIAMMEREPEKTFYFAFSGTKQENNWIINKSNYMQLIKEKDYYRLISIGTGL